LLQAQRFCPRTIQRIPLGAFGHLYMERGDYGTAAEWYRRAIEAAPDDADGYTYLGGVLAKQGRLDEAEQVHRRGVRCREGCVDEAYLNLGLILRAREQFEEAAECFREAIRLDPDYRHAKKALRDAERCIGFLGDPS
jgi:tetratricopeptide (TPR) repeat protein